jgi:methylamine---glutamate N-methyltransferase subunit B
MEEIDTMGRAKAGLNGESGKQVAHISEIEASGRTVREINQEIRQLLAEGRAEIAVRNPGAMHNLGVALLQPGKLKIVGSAGYYCGGLNDGATIEIEGSAGWGLAESMMSGTVRVHGSAGSGAAAALRGGTVVIQGHAGPRLGVSMKGGTVIVAGDCGYMAGFMAQKGRLIVCGDAGDAFADSMYETVCYVGGSVASLGTDAVFSPMNASEIEDLDAILNAHLPEELERKRPLVKAFRKVVSGRKLWNFDKRELRIWQEAL